jgi:hypothetical protein
MPEPNDTCVFCLQADEGPQLYWQFLDSLQLNDTGSADDGDSDSGSSIASTSSSSSTCWHSIIDQASSLCLPQVAKVCPVVYLART